ncbi:nucleotidyltransferase family protein [Magnetococcales bacterium HHB-1]
MKALVLAGGRGNRLKERTHHTSKCMSLIRNQQFIIENGLSYALDSRVEEIIIVVGYHAEQVINHFGTNYHGCPIRYVIQWEQKGMVDAISCAKEALENEDFMLFLCDEVIEKPRHQQMVQYFKKKKPFVICGVVNVNNRNLIKKTYTILTDGTSRIIRIIEKPENPINNIMGTGNCIIRFDLFNYIDKTPVHFRRGEKEFPDLIQAAIDDGHIVNMFQIGSQYVNLNVQEDLQHPLLHTTP